MKMMINFIKSEMLKQKRTFNNKILFLAPAVSILLAFGLMGPRYVENGAYNWWYITILPFTFTIISSSIAMNDKKKNYHGLFSVAVDKKKLWYSKIIIGTLYLFITCMIFFIMLTLLSSTFTSVISPLNSLYASMVLFITFAWQVPLFMFVGEKLGVFFSVITSVVGNVIMAVIFAIGRFWWIPFAIPARLMCSIIGVLPNGLMAEGNNILTSSSTVIPGLIICLVLYALVSVVGGKVFERREV